MTEGLSSSSLKPISTISLPVSPTSVNSNGTTSSSLSQTVQVQPIVTPTPSSTMSSSSTNMNRSFPYSATGHTERGNTPFDTDAYDIPIREPLPSTTTVSPSSSSSSFSNIFRKRRKVLLVLSLFLVGWLMILLGAIYESYAALGLGIIALVSIIYPVYTFYQRSRGNSQRFQLHHNPDNDSEDDEEEETTTTTIRW